MVAADSQQIRVDHSTLRRGRRIVLDADGFDLPPTGMVGLIGANGAGKSTLLLAVADLLTASSGTLTITSTKPPTVRMLLQAGALPRWASARDAAALHGADFDRLAGRYPGLRLSELADRRIDTLSGGDVQTLSLAIVVDGAASIVLLDEPFAHMDIARRRAALDIVANRRDTLIVLSAQTAADLAACDWFLVIRDGRYVFCGPRDVLLAGPSAAGWPPTERLELRLIELLGYDGDVAPENDARSFP